MKVTNFQGGLNIRLAPQFLPVGEGVRHTNIDTSKGHFAPINVPEDITNTLNFPNPILPFAYYYEEGDELYLESTIYDYVEFKNVVYRGDRTNRPEKRTGVDTWANLGIDAPTALAVATDGAGTGVVYTYAVTYYNSTDGSESAPFYSAEIEFGATGVDLSGMVASTDTQVTHKRIYRIGGDLTSYTRVATITNATTTYDDDESDDTAIEGSLLQSANYGVPPTGLKYLTEAYAMLWGIKDDRLYFTPIGVPNAWPSTYFLDLPGNGTGIALTPVGLLTFTAYRTVLVTGTGPTSLAQQVLDDSQGCINHDTIANLKGSAVWVSTDGICTSTGGIPEVISKDKLGKENDAEADTVMAVVYNEAYYLLYNATRDRKMLVWDFAYHSHFRNVLFADIDFASLIVGKDHLWGFTVDEKVYRLSTSVLSPAEADFKSGKIIGDSLTTPKVHDECKISYTGSLTVKLTIDGDPTRTVSYVLNKTGGLTDTVKQKLPKALTRGYFFELEVTGTGELFEFDLVEAGANV